MSNITHMNISILFNLRPNYHKVYFNIENSSTIRHGIDLNIVMFTSGD